ncbi:MAG: hypothetical protein BV459_01830 [Thermoplasmata archaeon M11B2D]|nr:MAG: hypothetical protein BV459_01830 [Thermoplasmata archaeon M11B2D]
MPRSYVEVEVDLESFDEEDIVEYLRDSGYEVLHRSNTPTSLEKTVEQIKLGNESAALDYVREEAWQQLGKII